MFDSNALRTLRKQITTGILILLPVITTIFLVSWLFRVLDGILGRYFAQLFGEYIHGVGFISLILVIWLVGMVSRTYIGGRLNRLKDLAIVRIPLIGNIFGAIKQVSDGFLEMDASSFEQVAIIEYPRKGLFAVGFVTSKQLVPFSVSGEDSKGRFAHVFMPTVPNPTSGYIILVPEEELYLLELTVEEGLKLVLSLGMIHPDRYELGRMPSARPARIRPGSLPETVPDENSGGS
ncbi:MAG: DUF502 domain-containing protein [Candidatus Glassbacteria bacterium]|nr:DUF502 domain-containing protein [Candidatus Glassbacteria bacterium]